MSRRRSSARFQVRRKKDTQEEEHEIVATLSRKRKAEDDLDLEEVTKRRQKFQIENQWAPIPSVSQAEFTTAGTTIPTLPTSPGTISPHQNNITPQEMIGVWCDHNISRPYFGPGTEVPPSPFRTLHPPLPAPLAESPLPALQWADSKEVWQLMLRKEAQYRKDPHFMQRHPTLQPRMRSILIDWLIEVCEVYRMHRETFYLAVDFIDRYLTTTTGHMKQQLQLIGITALFIAAKLEEIYPPRLKEFSFVTDGACTNNEILAQELVMLKALKWDLAPMTPTCWLNVYLQLVNADTIEEQSLNFVFPQYSSHAYIQFARLLDLCILDIESVQFPYSVLATAAVYHLSSEQVARAVSGYSWEEIAPCVQWMAPFSTTLREAGPIELKFFPQVTAEAAHNIQTHVVNLAQLEKAQACQAAIGSAKYSPESQRPFPGIITPPKSSESKAKAAGEEVKDKSCDEVAFM